MTEMKDMKDMTEIKGTIAQVLWTRRDLIFPCVEAIEDDEPGAFDKLHETVMGILDTSIRLVKNPAKYKAMDIFQQLYEEVKMVDPSKTTKVYAAINHYISVLNTYLMGVKAY